MIITSYCTVPSLLSSGTSQSEALSQWLPASQAPFLLHWHLGFLPHLPIRPMFSRQPYHRKNRMLGYTKTPHTTTRHALCLMLIGLLLTACGSATPAKTYTIGVVHYNLGLEPVLASFKAQMAASGYVEGKNVIYIYHGVLANDPRVLGGEVKRLVDEQVDLLLTLGTQPTLAAKKGVVGTAIPVVFAPVTNPVKQGIVESVTRPSGN